MRGILQLVVDEHGAALPPDLATLVQAGVRSGDTALKMVRDLLDFARLGNRDLTLEPVDLGPLLDQARADVKALFPAQGCNIRIEPLPVVLGHAGLLQQVFVNLLGNGVKYSASRPQPQVTVSAVPPGPDGLLRLQVADNGVGFDPALAARLFRPFQRLHPTGTFTGEGMGLANVKRIVERHGGTVTAEGRPGEGAVFTVALRPA
jgi:signal transduction histidine kinase